jgi:asparagine synthase (glutamine-hydrolysing)
MPGIAGIISQRPAEECQRLVKAMVTSMEHERFYASVLYAAPELGVYSGCVAHQRSSAADQVFFNEKRDIAVLLAGECLMDRDISTGLRRRGHGFETNNDLLAHLYEEQGEQFFENLNGLFSGLLVDKRQKKAFLFNDRYGTERIYWHQTRDTTYFASEAKALLSILPELRELDPNGVAQFLAFGCTLAWRTLFHGIRLLPGGSLWTFEDGTCNKRQYFDSRTWESLPSLSAECFESAFEGTFKRVLPRYFETNSKLGISLTGGLDTRMIMACHPHAVESPVSYTFTGVERETLDDRIAAQVAQACGLEHHLVRLGAGFFSDFASHADRTVYVTDGSFGITGAHEIYLNKQARQLAPVRLTGLYGSEILRGVSTFKPVGLSPSLINREFGQLVSTSVSEFAANGTHPITSAAFRNVPWNLFGSAAASRSQVILRTPYLDNEIVALAFQAPETLRTSPRSSLRLVENNSKRLRDIPTDRRIEGKNAGLINRLKRLFFEASFKIDYLHNEGMPNWLLPFDVILERIGSEVKIFGHHKFLHYRSWFRRELAEYVKSVVTDAGIQRAPFWNRDFLECMAREHIGGRKNYTAEINAVLTLEAVERLLLRDHAYREVRSNDFGTPTDLSAAARHV